MKLGFLLFPMLLASSLSNTATVMAESTLGYDFSQVKTCFRLRDRLYETPSTIEAWIKLGNVSEYEPGGVIFGNAGAMVNGGIDLEINADKHVSLFWNAQDRLVFDEYTVPIGTWTHLAVTRPEDCSSFSLYVNGSLMQTITYQSARYLELTSQFFVGSSFAHFSQLKNTFIGQIKQLTVYNDHLRSEEIYLDYVDGDNISYETRDDLLFNTYLSPRSLKANDTSMYANHGRLHSIGLFYEGELYQPADYTFVAVPDPQIVPENHPHLLNYQTQWILDNYEQYKIKNMMVLGDNTNLSNEDKAYQFKLCMDQYEKLNGKVAWTTIPGNHDYDNQCGVDRSIDKFNTAFDYDKISQYSYFGGAYQPGHIENAYWYFYEGGVNWLLVTLEFGPGDDVLNWANEVVAAHPNHRVLVNTHGYLHSDGSFLKAPTHQAPSTYSWTNNTDVNDGDAIFDKFLKKHKNIFMAICGHITYDDIVMRQDLGEHGNVVTSMLVDTQEVMNGHIDLLLNLLSFDELNQEIRINLVSSITDKLWNYQNQFIYSFKGHTKILSDIYYDENGELKEEYKDLSNETESSNVEIIKTGNHKTTKTVLYVTMFAFDAALVLWGINKRRKKHEK